MVKICWEREPAWMGKGKEVRQGSNWQVKIEEDCPLGSEALLLRKHNKAGREGPGNLVPIAFEIWRAMAKTHTRSLVSFCWEQQQKKQNCRGGPGRWFMKLLGYTCSLFDKGQVETWGNWLSRLAEDFPGKWVMQRLEPCSEELHYWWAENVIVR